MSDWQPISTAPKDGTKIDLWTGYNERAADAMWLGRVDVASEAARDTSAGDSARSAGHRQDQAAAGSL
ncbi:hypothetical protein [Paracoccus aminovorans]|uniref:hypothetical protein n=1 Tax=Paracoccus aminovorans TaxID=34004 RepID=UPI001114509B|nr:hypothetical protein [Paracoccus aminovorans]